MPGPVPKRSEQRRRSSGKTTEKSEGAALVKQPPSDSKWHPIAKRWYRSLAQSGQAVYYEPSDWATAYLVAESMSRDLEEQVVGITDKGEVVKGVIPLKGASLAAYLRAMANLLVTEGDRRRLNVELQRPGAPEGEGDADVSELSEYRRRLSAG